MTRAVRFQGPGPGIRIGRLEDDAVWDAGAAPAVGFAPTAEAWERVREASGACFRLDQVKLLAPVVPPQADLHRPQLPPARARRRGAAIPTEPVVFCKLPNSYTGPGDAIVLPNDEPNPDYEAEMALVIGTRIRRADRATARAAIGGVTALNDVSARRRSAARAASSCAARASTRSRRSGPASPMRAGSIPNNLAVRLTLSGERMQDSSTSDMIFDAEDLIVYISAAITLEPGDVIATGTPSGVGMGRDPKRWLRDGDVCESRSRASACSATRWSAEATATAR